MASFTWKDAFEIQSRNIQDWSKVLTTDAYLLLLRKVIERNDIGYKYSYDVCMRQDIDKMVIEIMHDLSTSN